MVSISFRIHKWLDQDKLIRHLHQYHKWFVVKETEANREHIQGYIEIENIKKVLDKTIVDKFRKDLKKNQDLKGNSDFSVKLNDGAIENIIYLCKGKGTGTLPDIIMNNKILENEVRLNHNKYWEKNQELKATDGKKKWYKIKEVKLSEKIEEKYINNREIIWAIKIIKYHDENDLLIPDDYSIKKMVRTYMVKETEGDKKDRYIENIARNIYDYS